MFDKISLSFKKEREKELRKELRKERKVIKKEQELRKLFDEVLYQY